MSQPSQPLWDRADALRPSVPPVPEGMLPVEWRRNSDSEDWCLTNDDLMTDVQIAEANGFYGWMKVRRAVRSGDLS
jgi:hypothetical protein